MVQIAIAVEVITCILGTSGLVAVFVTLVITCDTRELLIIPCNAVSAVGLIGEVYPRRQSVLVVDDHIFDDASSLVLEGLDHLLQFCLCTPATVVIKPEAGIVAHRLSFRVVIFRSLAALGNPDEVEVL